MRKAQQILELKKKKEQSSKQLEEKVIEPEVEEQEEEVKPQKKNMFAAFSSSQDEQPPAKEQQTPEEETKQETKKPKKKKKNKKKTEAQEEQEIDKLLQQIKTENIELGEEKEEDDLNIFKIYENRFNYEKELKMYFKNSEEEQVAQNLDGMNKREKKMHKAIGNLKMKKSILIPAMMNYFPIAQKFQFTEKDGMIWIEASKKYEVLQEQYEAIKNSNDINEMFDFMQRNPYHTDALYNIGEFFRLKGNYKEADALIQRIIYIYENSSQYNIGLFVKENKPQKQIAYGRFSSSFFMALFKFIDILGKKGCYKAGLEYCKFLLKLNFNDPSASLLCFDYNALSAKQYQYFIDFTENFPSYLGEGQKNKLLYWMPNYTYSFALAKFLVEVDVPSKSVIEQSNVDSFLSFMDKDVQLAMDISKISNFSKDSAQVLILRAILLYPKLILSFAEKNEYSKQNLFHPSFTGYQKGNFKSITGHKFFQLAPENYFYTFLNIDTESDSKGFLKVLECYVTRSKILWKNSRVMLWIKSACGFLLNYIDSHPQFNYSAFQQLLSIKSKHTQLIPQICLEFKRYENASKANFTDQVERIDLNNIQDNQGFQQAPVQPNYNPVNVEGNPFQLFFNTLLPWVHLPGQGQPQNQQDPDMPIIEEDHPN